MKYVSLLFILLAAGFRSTAGEQDSILTEKLTQIAAQIQRKYAPDKRVEYFSFKSKRTEDDSYHLETTSEKAVSEFRQVISEAGLNADITYSVLPSDELTDKVFGLANLSVINNRYSPSHSSEMATQSLLGTPVRILKKEKGYYFVRTPDNYLSWTEAAGILPLTKNELKAWSAAEKIVYSATYGHAFIEPNENALPVSDLVGGNILKLEGRVGTFYKVSFPDKRTAFVPVAKTTLYSDWITKPDPNADQILRSARSLLGVPYLWGGTSSKGVDCSGFTKNSFFMHGVVLPRDASQQALVGEVVDITTGDSLDIVKALQNLKPGDLLFFAGDSQSKRITHTALYIGKGEFIHSAGLVRINSMLPDSSNYADFQTRTLVSARRMLTSIGQSGISRIDQNPYYKLEN